MKNIVYPFPLPIYQRVIENSSFLKIKQEIHNFLKKNKELFKIQPNWNCNTLSTKHIEKERNIKSNILENEIKNSINEYCKIWKYTQNIKLDLKDIWINVAPPKSYQEVHHHHPHIFSGTLYINCPKNGGDFCIYNPMHSESLTMGYDQNLLRENNTIEPQDGLILLFPSWLNHSVFPNNSNTNRISVSFNINRL